MPKKFNGEDVAIFLVSISRTSIIMGLASTKKDEHNNEEPLVLTFNNQNFYFYSTKVEEKNNNELEKYQFIPKSHLFEQYQPKLNEALKQYLDKTILQKKLLLNLKITELTENFDTLKNELLRLKKRNFHFLKRKSVKQNIQYMNNVVSKKLKFFEESSKNNYLRLKILRFLNKHISKSELFKRDLINLVEEFHRNFSDNVKEQKDLESKLEHLVENEEKSKHLSNDLEANIILKKQKTSNDNLLAQLSKDEQEKEKAILERIRKYNPSETVRKKAYENFARAQNLRFKRKQSALNTPEKHAIEEIELDF